MKQDNEDGISSHRDVFEGRKKKEDIIPFAFLFKCRSKKGKTVQEVNGARTE